MPLADVLRAVTTMPRAILGADRPWRSADGTVEHATVFRVTAEAPPEFANRDAGGASHGVPIEPAEHIVPVAVIVAGRYEKVA